jgi:hypothetical protein
VNHPHIIMAKQHHVHPAHTRRLHFWRIPETICASFKSSCVTPS